MPLAENRDGLPATARALECAFTQVVRDLQFRQSLAHAFDEAAFRGDPTPESIILLLRRRGPASAPERNAVWACLLDGIRREDLDQAAWQTFCLGLLFPGLAASFRRLWPAAHVARSIIEADDVWSELITAALTALRAAAARPSRERLASRLVLDIFHEGHRMVTSALATHDKQMPVEECTSSDVDRVPARPSDLQVDQELQMIRLLNQLTRVGLLTHRQADILSRTRIRRQPLIDLAAAEGIGYEALRKRRDRAEAALLRHLRAAAARNGFSCRTPTGSPGRWASALACLCAEPTRVPSYPSG